MASFNINDNEPTASNGNPTNIIHKDIASIRKFDIIVQQVINHIKFFEN
jgi:hypothetical protein